MSTQQMNVFYAAREIGNCSPYQQISVSLAVDSLLCIQGEYVVWRCDIRSLLSLKEVRWEAPWSGAGILFDQLTRTFIVDKPECLLYSSIYTIPSPPASLKRSCFFTFREFFYPAVIHTHSLHTFVEKLSRVSFVSMIRALRSWYPKPIPVPSDECSRSNSGSAPFCPKYNNG